MKFMQSLFGAAQPLDPVAKALAAATPVAVAGPWRRINVLGVGGLNALGFNRKSEEMLVTSVNGQSVISGDTGEILYRNRDDDGLDISALKGTRLDHPADERFDMAGLFGGALRTVTDDGWSIEPLAGSSGVHCVLQPPGASVHFSDPKWAAHNKDATFHLIARESEDIRAFGFSWTGRTLVLATPSDLTLWNRPAPLSL